MKMQEFYKWLNSISSQIHQAERVLSRPANTLTFLIARFILMSGMIVGFSWWALNISP